VDSRLPLVSLVRLETYIAEWPTVDVVQVW